MKSHNRLFTATLVLLFVLAQTVWAQSWTIEQLTNTNETERNVDIAIEPNGDAHIVYEKRTYSGKGKNRVYEDHVYYAKQTNGEWGDPVALDIPNLNESDPAIDVVNGVAHVVFTGYNLIYYWNSAHPSELVPINNFPYPIEWSGHADIAVGSDSEVHIVFTATINCCGGNLYYTSGNADGFTEALNIETSDGNQYESIFSHKADIEIDDAGNIGILYRTVFHNEAPDYTFAVSYISKIGGTFSTPKILAGGGAEDVNNYPSLTYNGGYGYILYGKRNDLYSCGCPGREDLLVAKLNPETGAIIGDPIIIAQATWGGSLVYQTASVDQPAKLHVAYVGYYNAGSATKESWQPEIRYLQLNAETGEQLSSVESINDGTSPLITVDADGTVYINFTNSGDIFYAANSGSFTPPGGEMHVSDIQMSTEVKGARWNAVAAVFVTDDQDPPQPLDGVLVAGKWSGLVNSYNSATTGSDGVATFKSANTKSSGTITFTVTDVVKDGWTYDRAANFADPASGSISSPLGKQTAENDESAIPDNYALFNNYPNPFNPSTKIKYSIPEETYVMLKVYDVLGKEIASLVNQNQQPGYYEIEFDASNLSNDVYFYVLRAGDPESSSGQVFVETKKMVLLK